MRKLYSNWCELPHEAAPAFWNLKHNMAILSYSLLSLWHKKALFVGRLLNCPLSLLIKIIVLLRIDYRLGRET